VPIDGQITQDLYSHGLKKVFLVP